jgi:hypothetical protein
VKALNSWIKPPSPTHIFFGFKISYLGNSCWEKNEKNGANSKKNVNNKKIVKNLKSQI